MTLIDPTCSGVSGVSACRKLASSALRRSVAVIAVLASTPIVLQPRGKGQGLRSSLALATGLCHGDSRVHSETQRGSAEDVERQVRAHVDA